MSKATPGPWNATFADGGKDWIVFATGTPWQLAYLRDDKRANWPLEANARLIAAAPDLLAALQKATPSPYFSELPQQVAFYADSRAAIAKATGE